MTLLTIIIPIYNDAKYLNDCIDSVLTQSYQDFELILINKASLDNSLEIAQRRLDNRIRIIKQATYSSNSFAIKKALLEAKGTYIKLFCADDIMLPNCLKFLLDSSEGYDIIFSNAHVLSERGIFHKNDLMYSKKLSCNAAIIREIILSDNPFVYPTVLIKKDLLLQAIDLRLTLFFDCKIWLYGALNGAKFNILNETLIAYRYRKTNNYIDSWMSKRYIYLFEYEQIIDFFIENVSKEQLVKIFPEMQIEEFNIPKGQIYLICAFSVAILRNKIPIKRSYIKIFNRLAIHNLFTIFEDVELHLWSEKSLNFSVLDLQKFYNYRNSCSTVIFDLISKYISKTLYHIKCYGFYSTVHKIWNYIFLRIITF